MAFPGLMNDFVEACTLLEKTRVPDGEGGWVTGWTDGMGFQAKKQAEKSHDEH